MTQSSIWVGKEEFEEEFCDKEYFGDEDYAECMRLIVAVLLK